MPRERRHWPPIERLKFHLTENWIRQSSEVNPSAKFSRLPHWSSGPRNTFFDRVIEDVPERVVTLVERVGALAVAVGDVHHRVARRCSSTGRSS